MMIKVKLTFDQLWDMEDIHTWRLYREPFLEGGDQRHINLLKEHCAEFCEYFRKLLQKGCKTYRVKFTAVQALAFMQLWVNQQMPVNTSVIDLIEVIDKKENKPTNLVTNLSNKI